MAFDLEWITEDVLLLTWHRHFDNEALRDAIRRNDEALADRTTPHIAIQEAPDGVPRISPLHRQELSEWVQKGGGAHMTCRGTAFVTESSLARGLITAVSWVAPTAYPQKTFADRRTALEWGYEQLGRPLPEGWR